MHTYYTRTWETETEGSHHHPGLHNEMASNSKTGGLQKEDRSFCANVDVPWETGWATQITDACKGYLHGNPPPTGKGPEPQVRQWWVVHRCPTSPMDRVLDRALGPQAEAAPGTGSACPWEELPRQAGFSG